MYYAANGRPAYVIPDGDTQVLLNVARRFKIKWMVLEKDHVLGLTKLYQSPGQKITGLEYLGDWGENKFFIIHHDTLNNINAVWK